MKCIISKSGKTIDRVKNEIASKKVSTGSWAYCSKSEWKNIRKKVNTIVSDVQDLKDSMKDHESGIIIDVAKVHGLKAKDRKKLNKKKNI